MEPKQISLAGYWQVVYGESEEELTVDAVLYKSEDKARRMAEAYRTESTAVVGIKVNGSPVVGLV